ncbi:MAG: hypothetical protein CMH49_02260 [Myxococcales bacterium]|nr:hypothetical protein [Myxococcales bacterium]
MPYLKYLMAYIAPSFHRTMWIGLTSFACLMGHKKTKYRKINQCFFQSLATLVYSTLFIIPADALPPKHRLDFASAYTQIDVGDWQTLNAAYSYTVHNPFTSLDHSSVTSGLATRVLRREFPGVAPTDLSLQVPLYLQLEQFGLECWGEWSPQPSLVPEYSLLLSPSWRFTELKSAVHFTYRFAQYTNAKAHVYTPGLSWNDPSVGWRAGIFMYITQPEFGEVFYTPQLRLERYFTYFWRSELWITYGYETLNDRFVDPARQAPQLSFYWQIKHLFNDYSGLNLGLSWVKFLAPNEQIAQERFNRDRLEFSLRSFFRF